MTIWTVVRSEATKLLSLRSTRWTLVALVVTVIGFGALVSWGSSRDGHTIHDASFDPTNLSFSGLALGQLAIAVLGVLCATSEYSTGAIRTTLAAVPRRPMLLGGKAIVVGGLGLLIGIPTAFVAFFVGQSFYARHHVAAHIGDGGVLRAIFGAGLYVAASGLFGLALGALIRATGGAITATIAGLLVLPGLTNLLPGATGRVVLRYFTSNPGQQITAVRQQSNQLGPWSGYVAYSVWWAALLVIAGFLMVRRDA